MKKKTHLWTDDGGIRGERPAVVHCKRRHVSRVLERITLTTFGGNQRIARNEKREGLVMWESLHKLWALLFAQFRTSKFFPLQPRHLPSTGTTQQA